MTPVPGRAWAASSVCVSLVLSVILGGLPLVSFLRDGVHLYCEYSDVGESAPGSFFCADGIGYIVPVATIILVWALVSALGIVAMSAWIPPALRPRLVSLLSLGPAVYLSVLAADATGRLRATVQPRDFWSGPMLAVTVLLSGFAAVVLVLLVVRGARSRLVLYVVGGVLLLAALAAQPGMLAATLLTMGLFGASLILDRARYELPPTPQLR
ncbi:hypothetical protein SAMN06295879_0321 [Agreia bicolorata]|uniref:DUF998 domain-containing protein n=1 Tax=Agreia bicolorata TaxID=110935 RepID=A0A1T4WVQ7_9MICO|nr:hypothetical protein [Agreia bicolorata]SKA81396.1 hypothetical protein SAMN06295879_0321 [Agreia bicolorata]